MKVLSTVKTNAPSKWTVPATDCYWLRNAHVPSCFLPSDRPDLLVRQNTDELALVDIAIQAGTIHRLQAAGSSTEAVLPDLPSLDLRGGQVWPCFVDLHTHLDKGHTWERATNVDGSFDGALTAIYADHEQFWTVDDLYRRMEFGLKCSYAHGSRAVRTHLDVMGPLGAINLKAFQLVQQAWRDRLTLQAVALVPTDYWLTPEGVALADQFAEINGVLGAFALPHPELKTQLQQLFKLAAERGLDLDLHVDETDDPNSQVLRSVAEVAVEQEFSGQIVCGHCCSLAVQDPATVTETINWVKQAKIGVVSLPLCNLYLQDRTRDRTPRWRGVTLLHELRQQGVPVAIASDNCRDPFHAFGDHDGLEVFALSTRIAHFDQPYANWPQAITQTPAQLMNLPQPGAIVVGEPADLILFKGRTYSELLSRPQHDRIVLRSGQVIDTTLPDYAELDDLCGYPEI
jgi:cytosine/creatinine deaminase